MAQWWQRYRLFAIGVVVVIAATSVLLLFARDKPFRAGDVAINPAAAVDPERTYTLTVWEEEIIVPWAAKTQSEMLTEAIRGFQQQRPNAIVTYTIMEPDEAKERFATAIDEGAPPDVYGTARGAVWEPTYQVPASPYLSLFANAFPHLSGTAPAGDDASSEQQPTLLPAATAMLTDGEALWGWPKALSWHAWIGRPQGESVNGLFGADGRTNALDIVQLEQWLAATGAPTYMDAEGHLLWTEERLVAVARFVRALQEERVLPANERDASRLARTRVEALLAGEARAIGPVSPHLAQAILRHTPEAFSLVPPPGPPTPWENHHETMGVTTGSGSEFEPFDPSPTTIVDVSAYFVFRHESYAGDDHTRVASELAAYLAAASERWLMQSLGLIPGRTQSVDEWHDTAPLDDGSRAVLEKLLGVGPFPYSLAETMQRESLRAEAEPRWRAFLHNSVEPEQFATDIATALRAVVHSEDTVTP